MFCLIYSPSYEVPNSLAHMPSPPDRLPLQAFSDASAPPEGPILERISPAQLPDFQDDESAASLRSAIENSLSWYAKGSQDRPVSLAHMSVPARVFLESLNHFVSLADCGRITADTLCKDFDIFRVVPPANPGRMLVTGYYEPVLEGSLEPADEFRWPIYPIPSDLLLVELNRFDTSKFHGERLVGRLEKNLVVPYYTRSEIDGKRSWKNPERNRPSHWPGSGTLLTVFFFTSRDQV